jgi:putative YhbY family RNA-binding protein
MEPLDSAARRALRARAHHLHPVVTIGQHGLSPAVLNEIDAALKAHELIKVRVMADDRNAREALLGRICEALECTPVQQIGKLLVLWRARNEEPEPRKDADRPERRTAKRPGPSGVRRRSGAAAAPGEATVPGRSQARAAGAPPATRRRRPGDAPSGVPRASAPRRRRGF